jgi:flagellar L-ring protein precursor FlgH
MTRAKFLAAALALALAPGCARIADVGRPPALTRPEADRAHLAMAAPPPVPIVLEEEPAAAASLWTAGRQSLLGDRRARQRGDILTVVIEIDEAAEFDNESSRSRSGSESLSIPNLVGLPQSLDRRLTEGASLASAVDLNGASASGGQGQTRRRERLTLRLAATVVEVLPTGALAIEGRQEVRVNFELREMRVTGYVRPEDVSRLNEITYDKIASARISYGGRGQITDMQQPRYGQQVADILLPF